ncbi:MAG: hypothetical protein HY986_24760 [Candidatus Melainabacteria bacterium]|nr:hypothetical protein [Candidatus Melainabacteria bacterium]
MKSTLLKVINSALAGFLISASLVVFPGALFMRPSKQAGPAQMVLALNMSLEQQYGAEGLKTPKVLQDLMQQGFLLTLARNEADCLSFLLIGTCLGPLLIWIKCRQPVKSEISDQTNT